MINQALNKHIARVNPSNSIFFLCDIQTVFESKIYNMKSIVHSANTLCRASTILDIPLLVTEHNSKVKLTFCWVDHFWSFPSFHR